MLIGTTFAWFTDNVTSGGNIIKSGNLDLKMYWTDDLNSGIWYDVDDPAYNTIFDYDNWEPGYTEVRYVKLKNEGNLALNYKLHITPQGTVGKLAEVINVLSVSDENGIAVNNRDDLKNLNCLGLLSNVLEGNATANGTLLAETQSSPVHPEHEVVLTFAMSMLTTAGNDYQAKDAGQFTITALATQATYEEDSFGKTYDANAEYPAIINSSKVTVPVTPIDNKIPSGGVTLSDGAISATLPEGTLLEDGVDELTLTITPLKNSTSEITPVNNEVLIPVDVHIEGVSKNNTTPIVIELGEILPKYLNMGNYRLFHVENGNTNPMTLVNDKADLTAHNTFTYNIETGAVVVAMATFSEVVGFVDISNEWKGEVDTFWYTWPLTEDGVYRIHNADQLAGFAQIVGGMSEDKNYEPIDFEGKTVVLMNDINLNDGENSNDGAKIFYPIGYSNNQKVIVSNRENQTTNQDGVVSEVQPFKGTFDGNGHTISNFYQNTWEMFGDYNDGYAPNSNYYKDAMGLFAWVDGTVKNLTVDNFSSDGEFTPTGVIAAYAGFNGNATFENIAITNCNPRVYNTGNGGIVGIGGNAEKENTITFKNVTIDNTNKITALWGSWDVACGGLMGMFRGKPTDNAVVTMTNCHVAAQMDVYNDVCGNYQYYWYRYSGMLVGTNKNMVTDKDGYTVPKTSQYKAENCTVHFGDWNNYYYCELVENSLASYTHDHQFSRLTEIKNVDEIKNGENWTTTGNFYTKDGDKITCYHIRKDENGNFVEHKHTDSEKETVDGKEVYKEDKTCVYLPFNQLFTGYGWGVKHIPVYNGKNYAFDGVTILDRLEADSVQKFEVKDGAPSGQVKSGTTYKIGDLFEAVTNPEVAIQSDKVQVFVSAVDENTVVEFEYTPNTSDWTQGEITIEGAGDITISITDYYFCKTTTLTGLFVGGVDA